MSDRRSFLKTAGALVAGAALLRPSELLAAGAQNKESVSRQQSGSFGSKGAFALSWQPFTGQLKYSFSISTNTRSSTPIILTQLRWQGLVGYGEASMPPYLGESQASVDAFLRRVAAEVLPRFDDPFRMEDILIEVDRLAPGNCAAKASVDIALHDLCGKIMGQPWWKIWGFDAADTPCTSYTIGWDASDEIVREKTHEASWAKVLKVKLGRGDYEDKRMITLIREINPDTPIYIDANQGWKNKRYVLDMIHWLKERGVVMIEQPMSKTDLDGHAWLTERSPLPIIADEACQRLADVPALKGAYHGINIKLMKCTGMREAREMVSLAQALDLKLMMGCMTETSVAISAAAQLAPKMQWADLDGNVLLSNDCFTGMKLVEGKITLNELPGLGVSPL